MDDTTLEDGFEQITHLTASHNHAEVVRVATHTLDAFHSKNISDPSFSPKAGVLLQLCDIFYFRGTSEFEMQRYEPCLADVSKSLELGAAMLKPKEYARRVMYRGEVHFRLGKHLLAIRDFKAALASSDGDSDAVVASTCTYNLGIVCRTLPHLEAASTWFLKGDTNIFRDNAVMCALLLRVSTHEQLHQMVASVPSTFCEVTASIVTAAVIDYIMRMCYGHEPKDHVPRLCNEILAVLTNGLVLNTGDFTSIPKSTPLEGLTRSAIMTVVNFAGSFHVSEALQCHHQFSRRNNIAATSCMSPRSKAKWDPTHLHDLIAMVHSNDLMRLPSSPAPTPTNPTMVEEEVNPSSALLSPEQVEMLCEALPPRYRMMKWKSIYSTRAHGTSYRTLLANCSKAKPILIVIQDVSNNKMGAFMNVSVELMTVYGGNGETFVFTTCQAVMSPGTTTLEVFRWSRRNKYFLHFTADYFMFGGGGHPSIRVEETLLTAETYPCTTFESPALLGKDIVDVLNVEVWSFE